MGYRVSRLDVRSCLDTEASIRLRWIPGKCAVVGPGCLGCLSRFKDILHSGLYDLDPFALPHYLTLFKMRIHFFVLSSLLASIASGILTIKPPNRSADDTDDLKSQVLQVTKDIRAKVLNALGQREERVKRRSLQSSCTAKSLVLRRE